MITFIGGFVAGAIVMLLFMAAYASQTLDDDLQQDVDYRGYY